MTAASDAPLDLYIAAHDDPDAAQTDWDAIKQLAKDSSSPSMGSSWSAATWMGRTT